MTIYTAGYQAWRLEDLDAVAAQLGAAIVDIRFSPKSSREEWRKEALEDHFGARYYHIKALGNKNYQGGEIELANPRAAIAPVRQLLTHGPIILLCMCRDWHMCHRLDAAEFLADALDEQIEHLEPPSRKRAATPAQRPQDAPSGPEASYTPPTGPRRRLRLSAAQRRQVGDAWQSGGTLSLSVLYLHMKHAGVCGADDYGALVAIGREESGDTTDYSEEGR